MGESRRHITNVPLSDNDISAGKWVKPEQKLLCSLVSTYHWQVGQVSYSSCSRENVLHFKTLPTGVSVPDPRILYHLLMEGGKKKVGSGRGTLGLLHVNKNQITGTCGFISVPLPLLQHFCVSKFLMALWMSIHLRTKYICYSSNNISHDIKSISRVLFQGKQIRWEMIWNLFFFFLMQQLSYKSVY